MTPKKPCGGCTACCVVFCVVELDKPAHTPCQHLCDGGCDIHDLSRPATCANFQCGWTLSDWPDDLRPDRCGVIFMPLWKIGEHQKAIEGVMLTRSAHRRRVTKKHIEELVRAGHVLILTYEGESILNGVHFDRLRYPTLTAEIVVQSLVEAKREAAKVFFAKLREEGQ
jgi:hypothetical protein